MQWEWRIFVSCDSTQPLLDVWTLLQLKAPWFDGERTDVYFNCTETAGLKLRRGKTLEIKLRAERHSTGAEKWNKVAAYWHSMNHLLVLSYPGTPHFTAERAGCKRPHTAVSCLYSGAEESVH